MTKERKKYRRTETRGMCLKSLTLKERREEKIGNNNILLLLYARKRVVQPRVRTNDLPEVYIACIKCMKFLLVQYEAHEFCRFSI